MMSRSISKSLHLRGGVRRMSDERVTELLINFVSSNGQLLVRPISPLATSVDNCQKQSLRERVLFGEKGLTSDCPFNVNRHCEALKEPWQSTPPFVKGEVCVADRGIFSYLLNSVGGNK